MAKPKDTLTFNLKIDGAKETLKALNRLPKEANKAVKDGSMELARVLATRVKAAAVADKSPQSALLARTVRARRDRVPVIVAGGDRLLGRRKVPAWRLLFGAEMGSNAHPQFHHAHSGRKGYWFFPTASREAPTIAKAWNEVADQIVNAYGGDR
jgi:hypothetical protein